VGDGESRVVGDLTFTASPGKWCSMSKVPPGSERSVGQHQDWRDGNHQVGPRDFGLVFNMALEAGGVMVGDEVAIELELELPGKRSMLVRDIDTPALVVDLDILDRNPTAWPGMPGSTG